MKPGASLTLALLVLGTAVPSPAAIPPAERAALVALYDSAGGASWTDSSGWMGAAGTECSWFGVACDPGGNHVVGLGLNSNNLVGSLPEELGDLSLLQVLALGRQSEGASSNRLGGSIPARLWRLVNLRTLNLSWNRLVGPIPPAIGDLTRLQLLYLQGNQLTGPIPVELGSLAGLRHLVLGVNPLSGGIPAELGNLANLELLYLWEDRLSGPIPTELGNLSRLQRLVLDSNQLSGPIPTSLCSLTGLDSLSLRDNQLTGTIPAGLGDLRSLQFLRLDQNLLEGSIPANLGEVDHLLSLLLGGNRLEGAIPPELGGLGLLQFLDLSSNRLSGAIPTELGSLSFLLRLGLADNRLEGPVPAELGNLTRLTGLDLRANQLTGTLPASLAGLTDLADGVGLDLRWNGVFTDLPDLRRFLAAKQVEGDWESSQTVAPADLRVVRVGQEGFELVWQPISYTWDGGRYEVLTGTSPGGPYQLTAATADKTATGLVLDGLAPGATYSVVVRTVTEPHGSNRNLVTSETGDEVAVTTAALDECTLTCQGNAPAEAVVGETVVFSATATPSSACSAAPAFSWSFGDGDQASGASASHLYAAPGTFTWTMTAAVGSVSCEDRGSVVVFGAGSECGNGECEPGETAWTCPADCGLGPQQTGRVGSSSTASAVPAAVGGQGGVGSTFWVSEGMLYNPGSTAASVLLSFTPDGEPGQVSTVGPFVLAAGAAEFWANLVLDLFGTDSGGSVRLESDQPVMLVSRTFNDQPEGTYGQSIGAVGLDRALGPGDLAYLVGLSEDASYRANVLLQEVAGVETEVELEVYSGEGEPVGAHTFRVPALTKVQSRLLNLGFSDLTDGYATVSVVGGGQVVAMASVVDGTTGDAMTVDALHPAQAQLGPARRAVAKDGETTVDFSWSPQFPLVGETVQFADLSAGANVSWSWSFGDGDRSNEQNPTHVFAAEGSYTVTLAVSSSAFGSSFASRTVTVGTEPATGVELLVAVVAHLPGDQDTVWRSDLWVMNPFSLSQQVWLTYLPVEGGTRLRTMLVVGPGRQVAVRDVVATLFPDSGDGKGALRVTAPDGVFASSRTYNDLGEAGTFGQAVPALGRGDLLAPGEVGRLLKVKSTSAIRCNIGFTEMDGVETSVELTLLAAGAGGATELASRSYQVPAFGHLQVNRVFETLGVSSEQEAALATVEVVSGGRVYAFASNVDNRTGDGELIPAMRY